LQVTVPVIRKYTNYGHNITNYGITYYTILLGQQCKTFLEHLSKIAHNDVNPAWFNHFINLAKKLLQMFQSTWKNQLDKTEVASYSGVQVTYLPKWEKDVKNVINYLNDGFNLYEIAVSPICHTITHIYDLLKKNDNYGLGIF